jgi:glutamyl-tRNA reductase
MDFILVGTNHRTAPVELRERLALSEDEVRDALNGWFATPDFPERYVLSTCNRTEIFALARDADEGIQHIVARLGERAGLAPDVMRSSCYSFTGWEALRHLFTVASGLDSMVLGEPQILGQVKDAFDVASAAGTLHAFLTPALRAALTVGKRARRETTIGDGVVSVAYASVKFAQRIFSDLRGRSVLVIGAGPMSELALRHFVSQGVTKMYVVNRTAARAEDFAARFGGVALPWDELERALAKADIVLTSTAAPNYVLTPKMLKAAMAARRLRPIMILDIAVPRDADPDIAHIENVYLFNIDDLENVVATNIKERQKKADEIQHIIVQELQSFRRRFYELNLVPVIKSLRQTVTAIARSEEERFMGRFAHLSERDRSNISLLVHSIVGKILDNPTQALKRKAGKYEERLYLDLIADLFLSDEPPTEADAASCSNSNDDELKIMP